MKRLLCIVGGMNAGGAETFLMKIYRKMDKTKYQMDFCVANPEKGFYDDEILSLGGKIYHITPKSRKALKSFNDIRKVVKQGNYKYVLRTSQHSLSAMDLLAARTGGARVLVYRSSNSSAGNSKFLQHTHKIFKFLTIAVPNVKIAPSEVAAEFMFGKRAVKTGKVILLNNGIDLPVFSFSEEKRTQIRNDLKISGQFVVGHIGRFSYQKNHDFLLDIFVEIRKNRPDALLILIGTGELESTIKEKIKSLQLEASVWLLGIRSDIPDLLMAMDVMVFPSFYEGMPNTIIEAQASGLPCVVSDTITKNCNITGLVDFLSLNETAEKWASSALPDKKHHRTDHYDDFIHEGYDISKVVTSFTNAIFDYK